MLFPLAAPEFELDQTQHIDGVWVLDLHVKSLFACCPACKIPSCRVHSAYWRTLDDAPCAGQRVRLRLRVRRFRCVGIGCPRNLFTEPLPAAPPYARRTSRCSTLLLPLIMALGGLPLARLLPGLGLAVSGSTLLRMLAKAPLPSIPTPRVLGVDDWAIRRGHVYGTILIDLETRRPVDLLPDRTAETLAEWLRQHPGVEIVTRDRSATYAQGISLGAPDAIQVADRWHLLKNNLEALERALQSERAAMIAAACETSLACDESAAAPSEIVNTPDASAEPEPSMVDWELPANDVAPQIAKTERGPTTREQRVYDCVQALAAEGLSVYQIGKKTGFAKGTVRKYKEATACPQRSSRRTKIALRGNLDQHLRKRWQEGCTDGTVLFEELRALGFVGTIRTVQRHIASWRTPREAADTNAHAKILSPAAAPSAREARWWLVLPAEKLTKEQGAYVKRLLELSPRAQEAQELAVEFGRVVRERDIAALQPWMQRARDGEVAAFRSFVTGLRDDLPAVIAAVSSEWSNGQTEGQVNKLKLIKRQGYGRASVALLRKRLVA